MDGFLVIDKPLTISSRAAVDAVLKWLPGVRIGHTGTLDPLASGVLVLALGRATRLTEYVQRQAKVYRAGVRFGAFSATDDAEGALTPVPDAIPPERSAVERELATFLGETLQVPPAFSAAHVGGRRAYRLARKGKPVDLEARPVRIDRIDLLDYAYPSLDLAIECGKGTYIRSLARDLGRRLACGAYLAALRRTRIGPFRIEEALALPGPPPDIAAHVRPLIDAFVGAPRVELTPEKLRRLGQGQALEWSEPLGTTNLEIAVCDEQGELAAVATWDPTAKSLRPVKVLAANAS